MTNSYCVSLFTAESIKYIILLRELCRSCATVDSNLFLYASISFNYTIYSSKLSFSIEIIEHGSSCHIKNTIFILKFNYSFLKYNK